MPHHANMPWQQDMQKIKTFASAYVAESLRKITPRQLAITLSRKYALNGKQARAIINALVCEGELIYTYEHGCNFVVTSFYRPVNVSRRIVLLPPNLRYRPANHEIIVRIQSGAAFGSGEHPTTCLALRGIEYAMLDNNPSWSRNETTVADIGTGTGILAIAAVKLGVSRGIGFDIDACARAEARENVKLNGLGKRIRISDQSLENVDPQNRFFLITANLRTPTLIKMCARVATLANSRGKVILSGLKAGEMADIISVYGASGFKPCWQEIQKGWAGIIFDRIGQ
jgi:ribosomal protein L11 methyltransferase